METSESSAIPELEQMFWLYYSRTCVLCQAEGRRILGLKERIRGQTKNTANRVAVFGMF